jgi:nitroreductase
MNAVEMLMGRRSVRQFKDEKVSREIVKEVVNVALYAPSWMNAQICRYTVIDNVEQKAAFAKMAFGDFQHNINNVNNAAGVIVMSYINGLSGHDPQGNIATSKGDSWAMYDAGLAGQTLALAFHEKGIGSVILGVFDDESAGKFISLPENEIVAAIIPYGYPVKETSAPPRKNIEEMLRFK